MSSDDSHLEQTSAMAAAELSAKGSVTFLTPAWGRDGGVGAHVMASAAALGQSGLKVHVLTARVESEDTYPSVTVHHRPALADTRASVSERLGEHTSLNAAVTHLHQVDDPAIVTAVQGESAVVISAHGYPCCTSGVYYFEPGQECTRGHGPGCIPSLVARGCAHTRHPKTLPNKYRRVSLGVTALRTADLVVSYSNAVDRHLAANHLVRRAIVPYFPTMELQERTHTTGTRRVVFAGRIERPKGIDVLIRAAREVDGEFVICGQGRQEASMRELAEGLGIADRIHFAGWQDADGLAAEFARASVLVVPSVWPEPFGIVGIEALASGCPAVGSATGGIVDWLVDGVGGLLFAPGDASDLSRALNELLEDPERQRELGDSGRSYVTERFSRARHVEVLVRAYGNARSTWEQSKHL